MVVVPLDHGEQVAAEHLKHHTHVTAVRADVVKAVHELYRPAVGVQLPPARVQCVSKRARNQRALSLTAYVHKRADVIMLTRCGREQLMPLVSSWQRVRLEPRPTSIPHKKSCLLTRKKHSHHTITHDIPCTAVIFFNSRWVLASKLLECLSVCANSLKQIDLVSRCLGVVVSRFLDLERHVLHATKISKCSQNKLT